MYAKYAFRSHERKLSVIERLCDKKSVEFLLSRGNEAKVQPPDLLVYRADLSDWFFCEVKGPSDSLSQKQLKLFPEVEQATGKKVYIVKLLEIEKPRQAS